MSKKFKICAILLSVVLVSFVATSVGITAALWQGAAGDANTYGPNPSISDWNTWEQYFEYAENGIDTITITGFSDTNLEDMIIPKEIDGKTVTAISSTLLPSTLKSLIVTLAIPSTVVSIDTSTFAGCVNLQSVYFESTGQAGEATCTIGQYAFFNCSSLSKTKVTGGRALTFADGGTISTSNSFAGTPA